MDIKLHNTLSGKTEIFKPLKEGSVSMYHCGPTVYNYLHIGNLRAYVLSDLLRRTFEANGYSVKQVINITDVGHLSSNTDEGLDDDGEDKVEKMAAKTGKTATEISDFYTSIFFNDIKSLNIETENTIFPKASEHIPEQISLIENLEKGGHTYKTSDGVYFDTSTFPQYGKLGNIDIKGLMQGARVESNSEKKNITDFALWKFSKENEKRFQEWPSPWGTGFPGWHIECSAMSEKYLGKTFDIHTGGIDHIPVHHNNEIAQSESANGVPLANYWLHNAFVNVPDGKMSKSKENFIRLETLEEKHQDPMVYRYWLLTARYSTPVQFSFEAIDAAEQAYTRLIEHLSSLPKTGSVSESAFNEFLSFVDDDLDTPKALAYIWTLLKSETLEEKYATIIACDRVLGLDLENKVKNLESSTTNIPEEVSKLLSDRMKAREEKNWDEADKLRLEVQKFGFDIKDTPEEQTLRKM